VDLTYAARSYVLEPKAEVDSIASFYSTLSAQDAADTYLGKGIAIKEVVANAIKSVKKWHLGLDASSNESVEEARKDLNQKLGDELKSSKITGNRRKTLLDTQGFFMVVCDVSSLLFVCLFVFFFFFKKSFFSKFLVQRNKLAEQFNSRKDSKAAEKELANKSKRNAAEEFKSNSNQSKAEAKAEQQVQRKAMDEELELRREKGEDSTLRSAFARKASNPKLVRKVRFDLIFAFFFDKNMVTIRRPDAQVEKACLMKNLTVR
jgi:hypothetical protein